MGSRLTCSGTNEAHHTGGVAQAQRAGASQKCPGQVPPDNSAKSAVAGEPR